MDGTRRRSRELEMTTPRELYTAHVDGWIDGSSLRMANFDKHTLNPDKAIGSAYMEGFNTGKKHRHALCNTITKKYGWPPPAQVKP